MPANWPQYVAPMLLGAILLGMFWQIVIRPMQQQQKRTQSNIEKRKVMLTRLKVGDRIVTVGGMHGKVMTLSDDYLGLEIAKGTTIRIDRKAVSRLHTGGDTE